MEVAVQESSSGEIIVIHDTEFENYRRVPDKNWRSDSEQLPKMEAGLGVASVSNDESIRALQQIIESARGKIKLNIELRFNDRQKDYVERLLRILSELDVERDSIIMSRNYADLLLIKRLAAQQKVGIL